MGKSQTKKQEESIVLTFDEMDLVYTAIKDRVETVKSVQKKAKSLGMEKTEKAAIGEASKFDELLSKFLTPARERIEEEELANGEEEK